MIALTLGLICPMLLFSIECLFHRRINCLHSLSIIGMKSSEISHRCAGNDRSSPKLSSNRTKKALHERMNWRPTSPQSLSILVLCVEVPHMKEPRFDPRLRFMSYATSMFSVPRSPLTREGRPYFFTARRKTLRTVSEKLFLDAVSATT